MSSTLDPDEQAQISQILSRVGVLPEAIGEALANASFGPGVIGMQPDGDLPAVSES